MNKVEQLLTEVVLHETYWGKKIIAAEKRGKFTDFDCSQSGEWTTCACGRLNDGIPRTADNKEPTDLILYKLGLMFNEAVSTDCPILAAEYLIRIESRAAEVLKELRQ